MDAGTLCFVLAGVSFATVNLMKLIECIDAPRQPGRLNSRN